jgi:hypothetical protein
MLPHGEGHKAHPFKGRCCDDCHERVLKARLAGTQLVARLKLQPKESKSKTFVGISNKCAHLVFHNNFQISFFAGRLDGERKFPELLIQKLKELASVPVTIIDLLFGTHDFVISDVVGGCDFINHSFFLGVHRDFDERAFLEIGVTLNQDMEREARLESRERALAQAEADKAYLERTAQAAADEAYLAEERMKATAEKKAHKEAMELKKKQGTSPPHLTSPYISSPPPIAPHPPYR